MRTSKRSSLRWGRARRVFAILLALGLLAAACGGDDDEEPAGEETTAPAEDGDDTEPADDDTEAAGDVATGVGITEEPCPDPVNEDNGCIYLGVLSDLTEGPFAPLAVPITDAQEAFWERVNEDGGIGGAYDVDISEYTRDNKYNPEVHNQLYQEIKPNILAIHQTLGSPTTAAIIDDMVENDIVGAPASWTSLWDTEQPGTHILESGNNYCIESMNAIDFYAQETGASPETVMAVHYPGDYGEDGAAGAKVAAEAHGAEFTNVVQNPIGQGGTTTAAVDAIVQQDPDVVIVTTAPTEVAEIVGGAAAQGYQGRFIGTSPTWNPALLDSPAGDALTALYWQSGPWASFNEDTPGHQAMRDQLGDVEGNDGYTSGWAWSYPMKDLLELAYERGDLTREGLLAAIGELDSVDYEGMLPPEAGDFTGSADNQAFRQTVISEPDPEVDSGVTLIQDFLAGDTATNYEFTGACYEEVDLAG